VFLSVSVDAHSIFVRMGTPRTGRKKTFKKKGEKKRPSLDMSEVFSPKRKKGKKLKKKGRKKGCSGILFVKGPEGGKKLREGKKEKSRDVRHT